MESFAGVPALYGSRTVWLGVLDAAEDWRSLLHDADWARLVERERRHFGLMIVTTDPKNDLAAWIDFTDYCIDHQLMVVAADRAGREQARAG